MALSGGSDQTRSLEPFGAGADAAHRPQGYRG